MILFVLLFLVSLYFIYNLVFQLFWEKGLFISLHFSEKETYEGQRIRFREAIVNHKFLPLPFMQLSFRLHKSLRFENEKLESVSDYNYIHDIFSLSFFQKEEKTFTITCGKRGIYSLDLLRISTRNLLMPTVMRAEFPVNHTIVVFPKPIPSRKLEIFWQSFFGQVTSKKTDTEDAFSFRGIREYEATDPIRKINWKATAKTGELMVNTFFSAEARQIVLLLDLSRLRERHWEILAEESIRIAAALAKRFIHRSFSVQLISNGDDKEGNPCFSSSSSVGGMTEKVIGYGLAKIDLSEREPCELPVFLQERFRPSRDRKEIYVLISPNYTPENLVLFRKLCTGQSGIWVEIVDAEKIRESGEASVVEKGRVQWSVET